MPSGTAWWLGLGLLLARSTVTASSNTTAFWEGRRAAMIKAIFNETSLPTRSTPDFVEATNTTGLTKLVWDVSHPGFFPLNSSTYFMPRKQGRRAGCFMVHHHGHAQACDNPPWGCPKFWDFYNVSDFIHNGLGCDYAMLYMPLLAFNQQHGYPPSHQWFADWEAKGDFTIRYFIEPVVLSINHALALGYDPHRIYLMGKSGGGWTTTLAAAVDPRITVSFPIAGSVPLDIKVGRWRAHDVGDYEQKPQPDPSPGGYTWYLDECNYTCAYVLAGLEAQRYSVQILHENDPCCFRAAGRHDKIEHYDADVGAELAARPASGAFTTAVTNWPVHAVCPMDKIVIQTVLDRIARAANASERPSFDSIPCDMLRGDGVPCPAPPAPAPPPPAPPPPHPTPPHSGGCYRGAAPPCVYVDRACTGNASQRWSFKPADGTVSQLTIVHEADGLCLAARGAAALHTQLTLARCDPGSALQRWVADGQLLRMASAPTFCLNVGVASGPLLEFQLYDQCTPSATNEHFRHQPVDDTLRSGFDQAFSSCVDTCAKGEPACSGEAPLYWHD